jgi:hypothetical protein
MNLTTTHDFVIINMMENGTTFGVRVDTGESVYVSPRLSEQSNAQLDDICTGILVRNTQHNADRTPWVAAYVEKARPAKEVFQEIFGEMHPEPVEEAPRERSWDELADQIIAFLSTPEVSYCETSDISEAIDMETRKLSNVLEHMHNHGRICKAEVRQKADQERVSMALWSIDMSVYQ